MTARRRSPSHARYQYAAAGLAVGVLAAGLLARRARARHSRGGAPALPSLPASAGAVGRCEPAWTAPPRRATRAEIRAGLGEKAYRDAVRGAWESDLAALAMPLMMLVVGALCLFALDLLVYHQDLVMGWFGRWQAAAAAK